MPKLVTKFKYMKSGSGGGSMGGYAKYIATREGVEKLDDTKRHAPATAKQQELLQKMLRDFPNTKSLPEYQDYRREKTVGNASDLISRTLEENLDRAADIKTYADYIATRPRAERFGSHGLFTDAGVQVQLSQVSQELKDYPGHVYTAILSLRREDAARLGFDHGSRWRDFLRSQTQTLSDQLKIPMDHLRWYAAFHDEAHHPHVHLIAYSSVPGEGHLSKQGIEKIRSVFGKEIFAQDLLHTYERQTRYRDQLREQGRASAAEIVEQINSGVYANSRVEQLLVSLSERLSCTSGKKVYGYLKADVKAMVDEIVAELASDERIRSLYDLWYKQREEVLQTYTDNLPERVPLEQNQDFKPIRNAVIQEAMKIVTGIRLAANTEVIQDVPEIGDPPSRDPPTEPVEVPLDWLASLQPQFTPPESEPYTPEPTTVEPLEEPPRFGSDGRDWWSDCYKLARRYLYGSKAEKPDYRKALPLLMMEARRGNGYACYDIGRMYLMGQGCQKNEEEAQLWFGDALDAFHGAEQSAQKKGYLRYRIGKCHAYGHGTEQNHGEAARWFQQAVADGNPFAAYSLGGQYLRGQGVEQNEEEALRLFLKAASHKKQPNAYAQYQLGKMYRDGIGTEADPEQSKAWFSRAYAGFLAMEEAMADDRLYYRLGSMNLTGTGTAVDLEKAGYYFQKAAELGNTDALYSLAKLSLNADFSEYDPAKAVDYLEQAEEKGNRFARYLLGKLLCQGELVEKDIARGLPLLEELAHEGSTYGAYLAGKVYLNEEGWKDIPKAIQYFRQAAENGNSYGAYQLGRIYYFGSGVRADREKGLAYLKESAANGNEYAARLLQTIQEQHTKGAAACAVSLMAQLGRIFLDQEQKQNQRHRSQLDRKQRREIEEKKQALGIRD